jgi:hypothetical protein
MSTLTCAAISLPLMTLPVGALFTASAICPSDFRTSASISDMNCSLMKAGGVTLCLEAGREAARGDSRSMAEFSPCFATDSVKASYKALEKAGVPISAPYQQLGPAFALFRIPDPDGNLIEFAGTP